MKFFDTTSLGRILAPFSKENDEINTYVLTYIEGAILGLMMTISVLLLVVIIYPLLSIVVLLLLGLIIIMFNFYQPAALEIKELEETARTNLTGHVLATASGRDCIKAYNLKTDFQEKFKEKLDETTKPYYLFNCIVRWFVLRIEYICGILVVVTVVFLMLSKNGVAENIMLSFKQHEKGNNMQILSALSMCMILQVTGLLVFAFRLFGEANSRMSCIERIYQFTESLHSEHLPRRRLSSTSNKYKVVF